MSLSVGIYRAGRIWREIVPHNMPGGAALARAYGCRTCPAALRLRGPTGADMPGGAALARAYGLCVNG